MKAGAPKGNKKISKLTKQTSIPGILRDAFAAVVVILMGLMWACLFVFSTMG